MFKRPPTNSLVALLLVAYLQLTLSSAPTRFTKCRTKEGLNGICKPLPDCIRVQKNIHQTKPTICSYVSFFPVVCCPYREEKEYETIKPLYLTTSTTERPRRDFITVTSTVKRPGIPTIVVRGRPAGTIPTKKFRSLNYPGCGNQLAIKPKASPTARPKASPQGGDEPKLAELIRRAFGTKNRRYRRSNRFGQLVQDDEPKIQFIVGGKTAQEGSWPWMAAIYTESSGELIFRCGGTLISDRFVLTAAHCFKTSKFSEIRDEFVVRLGQNDRTKFNRRSNHAVQEIIVHEDFQPPAYYNDIALVKLKHRVPMSDGIWPICMPINVDQKALTHHIATILGWGSLRFGGRETDRLKEVDVPVTTSTYCNESYSRIRSMSSYPQGIIKTQLCAGYESGGKDACQGDSGGPLMVLDKQGRWTLGGIISGGFQCARAGIPGIYTRVYSYLQWILKMTS